MEGKWLHYAELKPVLGN
nr:hypothetical protein [Tanacetum cinerariifolium]